MNKITYLSEIKSADWQKKQNSYGAVVEGIEDIRQCILLILSTPKGSIPLDPTFGCDAYKYIDYPINEVRAYIIREVISAIRLNEKRVDITGVSVDKTETAEAVRVKVYYSVKNSAIKDFAEKIYDRTA